MKTILAVAGGLGCVAAGIVLVIMIGTHEEALIGSMPRIAFSALGLLPVLLVAAGAIVLFRVLLWPSLRDADWTGGHPQMGCVACGHRFGPEWRTVARCPECGKPNGTNHARRQ